MYIGVCICVLSHVSIESCEHIVHVGHKQWPTWTIAHQAPLSMEFSCKNTEVGCICYSRGSSWPRDWTHVSCTSCIGRQISTLLPGKLLDCKKIQPVHPKGDQSWVFLGRTDVEAETSIFWPLHAKSWLIGKDPDAGKDWGHEEKGTTEDEMADWHQWTWLTQWTWVWVDSGSWWWTGRPGVLQFMGSQRVGHDWATELNWSFWSSVGLGIHTHTHKHHAFACVCVCVCVCVCIPGPTLLHPHLFPQQIKIRLRRKFCLPENSKLAVCSLKYCMQFDSSEVKYGCIHRAEKYSQ